MAKAARVVSFKGRRRRLFGRRLTIDLFIKIENIDLNGAFVHTLDAGAVANVEHAAVQFAFVPDLAGINPVGGDEFERFRHR